MLEKIKLKLFPIRYSTLKEYFFWLTLAPVIMMNFGVICSIVSEGDIIGEFTSDFQFTVVYLCGIIWCLYCGSYRPMQWLFKKIGKKYEGTIIRTEMMDGVGADTFYFFIEFKKGKKTLIRRTSGYMGNPYTYLNNNKCSVYEFMGKFIEADFSVKKRFSDEADDEELNFHTTKHKLFMPKGDKYV